MAEFIRQHRFWLPFLKHVTVASCTYLLTWVCYEANLSITPVLRFARWTNEYWKQYLYLMLSYLLACNPISQYSREKNATTLLILRRRDYDGLTRKKHSLALLDSCNLRNVIEYTLNGMDTETKFPKFSQWFIFSLGTRFWYKNTIHARRLFYINVFFFRNKFTYLSDISIRHFYDTPSKSRGIRFNRI